MSRIIHESAVKTLVQGKIDNLQGKIERAPTRPDIAEIKAMIGALQTVISGLKWCPDAADDPHGAGGPYPIDDDGEA